MPAYRTCREADAHFSHVGDHGVTSKKLYWALMFHFNLVSLVKAHGISSVGDNINNMKLNRLTLLLVCKDAGLEVNTKKTCLCPVGRTPNKIRT